MALLNPGYWQSTYWPSSYWHEDYWQDYALTLTVENLIHDHSLSEVILFQNSLLIVQALLHAHTILGEIALIQTKPKVAENFSYKFLKLKILPPSLPEGDFTYEQFSLKDPDLGPDKKVK